MHEEIVPDSEPERDENKRRDREARQKKRVNDVHDIIDLTDNTLSSPISSTISIDCVPKPVPANPSSGREDFNIVIEISGTFSLDFSEGLSTRVPDTESSHSSDLPFDDSLPTPSLTTHSSTNSSSKAEYTSVVSSNLAPSPSVVSITTNSGLSSDSPRLDLTRFAYNHARLPPPISDVPLSGGADTNSLTREGPPPRKKMARSAPYHSSDAFSELELSRLTKCVSCDTSWTTRKGNAQKMSHIRSCAKKKGWTDDTVRVLIRKELDNVQAKHHAPSRERKGEISSTLLEDVVNDTGLKRKNKRQDVVKTIKKPLETRPEILDRARVLLGRPMMSADELIQSGLDQQPPATQAFSASRLDQEEDTTYRNLVSEAFEIAHSSSSCVEDGSSSSHATHSFLSSNFGQQTKPVLIESSDDGCNTPPMTQKFTPSSLSHDLQNTWDNASESIKPAFLTDPSDASRLLPPYQNTNLSQLNQNSPVVEEGDDFAWQNDDALLHFDPDLETTQPSCPPTFSSQTSVIELSPPPKLPVAVSILPRSVPQVDKSRKGKEKAVTKKKTETPLTNELNGEEGGLSLSEELESRLLQIIRGDKELYLRILRYEPIQFDDFVQMATMNGLPARGLKLTLWQFLDKQGINFYGAYQSGSRSRKHH